eukprot:scaffold121740_cov54-Phaeocystis_antarctica.AAC.2
MIPTRARPAGRRAHSTPRAAAAESARCSGSVVGSRSIGRVWRPWAGEDEEKRRRIGASKRVRRVATISARPEVSRNTDRAAQFGRALNSGSQAVRALPSPLA